MVDTGSQGKSCLVSYERLSVLGAILLRPIMAYYESRQGF